MGDRALQAYIQDIRNCSTKEAEKERVDKELGKIRKKYTSDKAMTGVGEPPGRGAAAAAAVPPGGRSRALAPPGLRNRPLAPACCLSCPCPQPTTSASTCGSFCTPGCWAMTLTSGSRMQATSSPPQGAPLPCMAAAGWLAACPAADCPAVPCPLPCSLPCPAPRHRCLPACLPACRKTSSCAW